MSAIWIAIVLGACTLCGALAVMESTGVVGILVKCIYATSTLALAAYLAMHGGDQADETNKLSPARPALDVPSV